MQNRKQFIRNISLTALACSIGSIRSEKSVADTPFIYQSAFIKMALDKKYLQFVQFSTDSLGKSQFSVSPLLATAKEGGKVYTTRQTAAGVAYYSGTDPAPVWEFAFSGKEIKIHTRYIPGAESEPLLLPFSQKLNHCTVLGHFARKHQLKFPCVLHFPGMGTFRTYCSVPDVTLQYEAGLTENPFVNMLFPQATEKHPLITYTLRSVTIYPGNVSDINQAVYDGFKKNYINIFQLNPDFQLLANNTTSDACAFTLFLYAEMARKTPPLVEGLAAFDLVRTSLDRYLEGFLGYGMVGKPNWHSKYNSSDSFPSLVIAACYYILETKDEQWGKTNYKAICVWADAMIETDRNNDGIIEYGYSGNANSWNGDTRPANWWDTIGFGHDDAYSNALAYRACSLLARVAALINDKDGMQRYSSFAGKLKAAYYKNFYNPVTGVLAGWKSGDGKLHDYYFTFVNSVAVYYGLLSEKQGRKVMYRLLEKMKEAGYNNFRLGLPGNLIPVRREDYIHFDHRWGYGKDEEGKEGFQIYENGGATACYAYYTIQALRIVGMKKEAEAILAPMLESFTNGDFEGNCTGSTMTKDWKTWKGECWGYEGFLVDNYLTLLAVVER